jgi:DNA-binding PadR family transcriptional regulator
LNGHQHHHKHHMGHGPFAGGVGIGLGPRRGEFRFLILIALSEKPMHGYALIQEIGQTYQRPVSAGLVYPTLQELQDIGFVSSEEKDGKKVYSITREGIGYLKDNEEIVERLRAGKEYAGKMGQFSFMRDLHDIQDILMMNPDMGTEKMTRIQDTIGDAKRKVAAIVFS